MKTISKILLFTALAMVIIGCEKGSLPCECELTTYEKKGDIGKIETSTFIMDCEGCQGKEYSGSYENGVTYTIKCN